MKRGANVIKLFSSQIRDKLQVTALTAAMRYILKSESFDRRGQGEKLYCIIAGSAVSLFCHSPKTFAISRF